MESAFHFRGGTPVEESPVDTVGIRFVIDNGKMLTKNKKPFKQHVVDRFQSIIDGANKRGVTLTGKICAPDMPFYKMLSVVTNSKTDSKTCEKLNLIFS